MNKLDNLSSVANEMLDGLKADPSLLHKAGEQAAKRPAVRFTSYVPALCCVAVLVCCIAFLPGLTRGNKTVPNEAASQDTAAGFDEVFAAEEVVVPEELSVAAAAFPSEESLDAESSPVREEDAIVSYSAGTGSVPQENLRGALLDLSRKGSSSLSSGSSAPSYQNLWVAGSDGVFPLIRVEGKYYRQLKSGIDEDCLGKKIGAVEIFTTEPALEDSASVMSNIVPVGNDVYRIGGMDGTLVAAYTDSGLYAFQRVTFNGQALKKGEGLSSVLNVKDHVISLSLTDVGTVTDAAEANSLISVLLKKAVRESSGSLNSKQALHITLDNGIVLQMTVKDEKLSSCGTWSCPEFFDAFEKAAR